VLPIAKEEILNPLVVEACFRHGERLAVLARHGCPRVASVAARRLGINAGGLARTAVRDNRAVSSDIEPNTAADLNEEGVQIAEPERCRPIPRRTPDKPEMAFAFEPLLQLFARAEQSAHIAKKAGLGVLIRGERHTGPTGKPAVHPGNAVVARAEKALRGLERQEREDPMLDTRMIDAIDLDVVVLGRDEHVQLRARARVLALQRTKRPFRYWRLEERGFRQIADNERERLRAGSIFFCRAEQQRAPGGLVVRNLGLVGPRERERGELNQKGVHGVLLVGLHSGERSGQPLREPRQKAREGDLLAMTLIVFDTEEQLVEQVVQEQRGRLRHRRCPPRGRVWSPDLGAGRDDRRRRAAGQR